MDLFFSQRDPRGKLVAQAVFLFLLFLIHPFCFAQKGPARLVLTPKDQILQVGQSNN